MTFSYLTSEIRVRIPTRPQVGKLLAIGWRLIAQNFDKLYVLVSSTFQTSRHNISDTKVLRMM